MSASDRLDEIEARYLDWHNGHKDAEDPDNWTQRDPGETMDHCIVRNDVPALITALRTVLGECHNPNPERSIEAVIDDTVKWFYGED